MKQDHFPQNHKASKGTKRLDFTYESLQTKELVLPLCLFIPNNNPYVEVKVFDRFNKDILKCLLWWMHQPWRNIWYQWILAGNIKKQSTFSC